MRSHSVSKRTDFLEDRNDVKLSLFSLQQPSDGKRSEEFSPPTFLSPRRSIFEGDHSQSIPLSPFSKYLHKQSLAIKP